MAQILTRASVAALSTLDAGDTVECYVLSRLSRLETFSEAVSVGVGSSVNDANETTSGETGTSRIKGQAITVRKTAISFRFKSHMQATDSRYSTFKPPFELTLEYGPKRTGKDMDSESLPMILSHDNFDDDGSFNKFLSWDNEGKIYYEESISSERWDTADYIAPITGSVLAKVLEHAFEYPSYHPRFQPFEVYDLSRDSVIIRSSSAEDFVWDMFDKMAEMFVDIRPILSPSRSKARFYVDDLRGITKVKMSKSGDFVQKQMGNPQANLTNGNEIVREVVEFYENMYTCSNKILNADYELFLEDDDIMNFTIDENEEDVIVFDNTPFEGDETTVSEPPMPNNASSYDDENLNSTEGDRFLETLSPSNSPSIPGYFLTSPSPYLKPYPTPLTPKPTNFPTPHQTESPESTTAAQATAIAMSQNAKQDLLSGVGSLMTAALLPCFTPSDGDDENIFGYLFLDSATYYKLNLTYPYLNVTTAHPPMPVAKTAAGGNGDLIDYMFIILIVGGLLYGMMRILKESALINEYKGLGVCWKRFFNMRENEYYLSGYDEDGHCYKFGHHGIPSGMENKDTKKSEKPDGSAMIYVVNGITIMSSSRSMSIDEDDREHATTESASKTTSFEIDSYSDTNSSFACQNPRIV